MQTEQELEALVRACTPALLRYCTGLLGCEADAQDAVQATFIKAWERRHTLRGGGQDNERAWLYRIAYRTALDMLRAARRAEQRKPPEPLPPRPRHHRESAGCAEYPGPAGPGTGAGAGAGRPGLRRPGPHPPAARRLPAHPLSPGQTPFGRIITEGGTAP